MSSETKTKMKILNSYFPGKKVPLRSNSENTTPNPVVEGGTLIFIALVAFILTLTSSFALDVNVHDGTGFEIDVFNVGETAYISAVAEIPPWLEIETEDNELVVDTEMELTKQGIYIYEFVPEEKAAYTIKVNADNELKTTHIYVTEGLDIDWEEIAEQNRLHSAESNEAEQEQGSESERLKESKQNIFIKIFDYLKNVLGIVNG